jgi:hypothetical protein
MSKPKTGTNSNQDTFETYGTTLAKRVLNSNLSDEDKISLIQLIGSHPDIISIPSVWTPDPRPLEPIYHKHHEFVVTCSAENDACPNARVSCLNDEK